MSISSKTNSILVIVGPTAAGKTVLSLELAKTRNGEIVSADSRQIYRGMDVGTAKPSTEEQCAIPHHLIDIRNPDEEYTVAEYKADAVHAIQDILRRGKLPIMVGGTGLYVKAVLENLDIPKIKADPALRRSLEDEIKIKGLPEVFNKLIALDPEAAYVVDPKNPRRVVRALEVALTTGEPFTAQRKKNKPMFDARVIGLDPGPEALRERINTRVDKMIRGGLVEEVRGLIKQYPADLPAFDAIGYREIISHLNGTLSLADAVASIKTNTWHYAKRQLTWFKKDKGLEWMEVDKK